MRAFPHAADKPEGLAITDPGETFVVTDNDGVDVGQVRPGPSGSAATGTHFNRIMSPPTAALSIAVTQIPLILRL